MKRLAMYGLATVVLLVMVAVAGLFSATRAVAQTAIKAVLVKNSDERGRLPYQSMSVQTCSSWPCEIQFDSVPPGKRLVIEHVGGTIWDYRANGTAPGVELLTNCYLLSGCGRYGVAALKPFLYFQSSDPSVDTRWGLNETVLAYVEEGARPGVRIQTGAIPQFSVSVRLTVAGYLIDKSN